MEAVIVRVYLPTTLGGSAEHVAAGLIPESAERFMAPDQDEESEYAALMEAAAASAGLLAGPGRRVVVVAEMDRDTAAIRMECVVAVHVDTEDDADEDDDLAWFAPQEIPGLIA